MTRPTADLISVESGPKRVLVAGVGNVFLGDDGFGVEVVAQLAGSRLPNEVEVADFGIRGFDLAYALMDGYEAVVLVDAVPKGQAPGTVYVIEPDTEQLDELGAPDGHSLDPVSVLRLVKQLGGRAPRCYLIGCEPASLGPEEGAMGLSPAVEGSVGEAVAVVEDLVQRLLVDGEVS